MNQSQLSRVSAGLGGMAIALLLVGLVVQGARAGTVCENCQAWADQQALYACDQKGISRSSFECMGLRQGYRTKECNESKNGKAPICPDGGVPTGTVTCGSLDCAMIWNFTCSEMMQKRGGGSTCNNECWSRACGTPIQNGSSGGIPGTCKDKQVGPDKDDPRNPQASVCYVTCGCME